MSKYLHLLLASCLSAGGAGANAATDPEDTHGLHQRERNFVQWNNTDLQRAEELFLAMFNGDFKADIFSAWTELGMALTAVGGEQTSVYKLAPTAPRQGSGYYLFRSTPSSPIALQAPHQFHDRDTGHIAKLLFFEHSAAALALNSAHRFRVDNRASNAVYADLAHNAASPMMAFTRAFATVYRDGKIVQIHGFARSKRDNRFNQRKAFIISGGTRWVTPASSKVANCLSQQFADVALFPLDINELGGTTNSMANWLTLIGHKGFIHIEIDAINRKNLLNKRQLRDGFWSCL